MSDAPSPYPPPPAAPPAYAPPGADARGVPPAPRLVALIAVFSAAYAGCAALAWVGIAFFGLISYRDGRSGAEQFAYVLGELLPFALAIVAFAGWHLLLARAVERGWAWGRGVGRVWIGLCFAATLALLVWLRVTNQGLWQIPAVLLAVASVIVVTGVFAERRSPPTGEAA